MMAALVIPLVRVLHCLFLITEEYRPRMAEAR